MALKQQKKKSKGAKSGSNQPPSRSKADGKENKPAQAKQASPERKSEPEPEQAPEGAAPAAADAPAPAPTAEQLRAEVLAELEAMEARNKQSMQKIGTAVEEGKVESEQRRESAFDDDTEMNVQQLCS